MRLTDRLTVISADQVSDDAHGNPSSDWGQADELTTPATVVPVSSVENLSGQDEITTRYRVFLPTVTPVTGTSRIRWHGQLFEVDGDVEQHADIRGRPHHLELLMVARNG